MYRMQLIEYSIWVAIAARRNLAILPHSALSWNFSLTENLARLILQDSDTKWHYFPPGPPTRQPPDIMDFKMKPDIYKSLNLVIE